MALFVAARGPGATYFAPGRDGTRLGVENSSVGGGGGTGGGGSQASGQGPDVELGGPLRAPRAQM